MQTIAEAIAEMQVTKQARQLIPNWRATLPPGSRWQPNDIGDPACPECKGVGYLRIDLPVGHPMFGKLFECDCAHGKGEAIRAAKMAKASGLSQGDLDLRFSKIAAGPIAPALAAARELIQSGGGWLYVWGNVGTGKTLLARTFVAECLRANKPAVYGLWPDVLQYLRAGYDAGDYDARVEEWRSFGIVVLDEFGRFKETEWTREVLPRLFNRRYESGVRGQAITVIISNDPPESLPEWLTDRVNDGRFAVIHVGGPSMRPLME